LTKVIGVFRDRRQAESAISQLRNDGFSKDISILGKDEQSQAGNNRKQGNQTMSMGGSTDPISDGSTTGGIIGGLAGLAAGAGALVIPGIGPLLAAGPIAGALTGAVTGGVAGGLVDWGIPAEESKRYEDHVRQGNVLVSVECSDNQAQKAMDSLRQSGAQEVKKH